MPILPPCEKGCNCRFCLEDAAKIAASTHTVLKPVNIPFGFGLEDDQFRPATGTGGED